MDASNEIPHGADGVDFGKWKNVAAGSFVFLALLAMSLAEASWPGTDYILKDPGTINAGDTAWMIVASALVLIMTPGLGFFYGGMVRAKNVLTTVLQSYAAIGIITVLWVFFLFSLCFGDSASGFIGSPATYFLFRNVGQGENETFAAGIPFILFSVFQLKFAIITPALISGSFSERVDFKSWCLFMCLWSILVYAPIAHLTWHPQGLLRVWGVLDFAGGTVVHLSSGVSALAGAIFLGSGESHRPKQKHSPAHVPYVMLGTALLLFGWFGFNAGSALAANGLACQAFMNTHISACSAMLTWLMCDYWRGSKLSASGACIGAVVGLVGITPACGYVTCGASLIIGIVAAIVSNVVGAFMKHNTAIDDTLDVFSCHGMGGLTGVILTGLFATTKVNPLGADGAFYGNPLLLGKHIAVLAMTIPYFFIMSLILYKLTDMLLPMRVDLENERKGLDHSLHGESILPLNSLSNPNMDASARMGRELGGGNGDVEMSNKV